MTAETIESRLPKVEIDLKELKANASPGFTEKRGWRWFVGVFQDNPRFEEAMRAGQEWRRADKTNPFGVLERMGSNTLEERITAIESQLAQLIEERNRSRVAKSDSSSAPWWKQFVGIFEDDPSFDDAERFGKEWRNGDRTVDDRDHDESAL